MNGMNNMNGIGEEQRDELVEEHLRHVRGEGPEPDLSGLSEADAEDVRRSFAIVDALSESLPPSLPIEEDPVATRLGLVPLSVSAGVIGGLEEGYELVAQAVHELLYRYPQMVDVQDPGVAADVARAALHPAIVCRSLAERVLVIVYQPESDTRPGTREALVWFGLDVDATAVAFTSVDAQAAKVVTFPDCYRRLNPSTGWSDVVDALAWEPLGIALGRYFEQSIMHWDEVSGLDPAVSLGDLTDDVTTVVGVQKSLVASSKPRLEHKRGARDYVAALPDEFFVRWVSSAHAGESTGDEVADEIREHVQTAAQ